MIMRQKIYFIITILLAITGAIYYLYFIQREYKKQTKQQESNQQSETKNGGLNLNIRKTGLFTRILLNEY